MEIAFTKVKLEWGFLSNMSPHPVRHEGRLWATTEALFQALRFRNAAVRDLIWEQKSPMTAKMMAKKHKAEMMVAPGGDEDLANMRMVLRLKIEQHPSLRKALMETGEAVIIEDCTSRRASIWGARRVGDKWEGDNLLGKLWVELRDRQRHSERTASGTPA